MYPLTLFHWKFRHLLPCRRNDGFSEWNDVVPVRIAEKIDDDGIETKDFLL